MAKNQRLKQRLEAYIPAAIFIAGILSIVWFVIWLWLVLPMGGEQENATWLLDNQVQVSSPGILYVQPGEQDFLTLIFDTQKPITITLQIPLYIQVLNIQPAEGVVTDTISPDERTITIISSDLVNARGGPSKNTANRTGVQIVAIGIENAQLLHGGFLFRPPKGFSNAIQITAKQSPSLTDIQETEIDIESVNHARWRVFAQNNSFLAIAPFLVTLITMAWKGYTRHKQEQAQEARETLQKFRTELMERGRQYRKGEAQGEKSALQQNYEKLKSFWEKNYIDDADYRRVQLSYALLNVRCEDSDWEDKSESELLDLCAHWPDEAVAILEAIFEAAGGHSENARESQTAQQENQGTGGHDNDGSKTLAGNQNRDQAPPPPNPCNQDLTFIRLIRSFPREQLSEVAATRYAVLIRSINPSHVQGMPGWANALEKQTGHKSVFAASYAEHPQEKQLLFAGTREPFLWNKKPNENQPSSDWNHIYWEILTNQAPAYTWLVFGKPGTGKTAMALAVGQYLPDAVKDFGCYQTCDLKISTIQSSLAHRLLELVCRRILRLLLLNTSDRRLLADLWLAVLPFSYISGQIASLEHQFGAEGALEERKRRQAFAEQSLLLRTVEEAAKETDTLLASDRDEWLHSFAYLLKKLGMSRQEFKIYIAADLQETPPAAQLQAQLEGLTTWFCQTNEELPVRLLVTLPSPPVATLDSKFITVRELSWSVESLKEMWKYRVGLSDNTSEDKTKLIQDNLDAIIAANPAPGALARLWLLSDLSSDNIQSEIKALTQEDKLK